MKNPCLPFPCHPFAVPAPSPSEAWGEPRVHASPPAQLQQTRDYDRRIPPIAARVS